MDKWTEILDRGGVIDVVYCDFQKAFDTVPHKRLIEVLAYYGFTNPLLSWVKDFLTGRTQQVIVNGCISRKYEVTSGVPQGSVLGPVLFIIYIYINLLIEKSNSKNMYVYADDLKIFEEIKGAEDADGLQKEIDTLYDWTQYSLLKLHPGKCVVMRIKPKRKTMSVNSFYDIDQTRLKSVKAEKDLGIVFDDELSFREHINCKVKKANSLAGIIRRTFLHMDKVMFKRLFVGIVRTHLEYGAPIWNPYNKDMINIIEMYSEEQRGKSKDFGINRTEKD